ncbi:MAG: hypothetical protein ACR2RF_24885 [Geminicoccaceae bacterium]
MNHSPYLDRPLRSYQDAAQDLESHRDHQPDIKFGHDALEWGEHRAIAAGHTIRREVRRLVENMKHRWPVMHEEDKRQWDEDIDWLREARKAHSKAIANREAYRAAINEREIQRELGLVR